MHRHLFASLQFCVGFGFVLPAQTSTPKHWLWQRCVGPTCTKNLARCVARIRSHGHTRLVPNSKNGERKLFHRVRSMQSSDFVPAHYKGFTEFLIQLANGSTLSVAPFAARNGAWPKDATAFFVGFNQPRLNHTAPASQHGNMDSAQMFITSYMQPQPALVLSAQRQGSHHASNGCVVFFSDRASAHAAHKYVLALARLWQQAVYFQLQTAALHSAAPQVLTVKALTVANELSTLRFTRRVHAVLRD